MSASSFTEGPDWFVEDTFYIMQRDGSLKGSLVCEVYDDDQARLISAAPDLYQVAEMVLKNLDRADDLGFYDTTMDEDDVGTIRAAVRKARGEES